MAPPGRDKRHYIFWTLLLTLLSIYPCGASAPPDRRAVEPPADNRYVEPRRKSVLALYSYSRDSADVQDVTHRRVLSEAFQDGVDFHSEYLDRSRFGDEQYQKALREYLRATYSSIRLDVIIAASTNALEFVTADRDVFGNAPIVFNADIGVARPPNSTGIVAKMELGETMALAKRLQPDLKRIFVVSGVGELDTVLEDLVRDECETFHGEPACEFLSGLSGPELRERVRRLPEDSMVFYVSVARDAAGNNYRTLGALDLVLEGANAPVYSWVEPAVGRGVVGGSVRNQAALAARAAAIAVQVLRGVPPDAIPVTEMKAFETRVDARQLRRWNIPEARVPAGSTVLFRPRPFLEAYRGSVVVGLLIFLAQLGWIAGLLIQSARRRRAEERSRISEARNSAILRAIPDLMFVIRRDGTYVDYHARDRQALFAPPSAFLGKNVRDIMPRELSGMLMDAIDRACESVGPVVVEYELPMDGTCYYEARIVQAGEDRVLTIVRDVTEAKRARQVNRDLAGRLIAGQEAERQRIARDLHDDLSQKIALLSLEIDQMASEAGIDGLRSHLQTLSYRAREIGADVRDLSHELHPSKLQTLGLVAAIQSLCRDISRQAGVQVAFTHGVLPETVDPNVSLCLYRITQEALHNVARHSQAREAQVQLAQEGDGLVLHIADSGVGFDAKDAQHEGLGLHSMRERVAFLRGQLAIHASPGGGTRIGVRVPLAPSARAASAAAPLGAPTV